MIKATVLEKVKKLLALSTSPNEHEAALAAKKAHALLAEHNLSMMDVPETQVKKDEAVGHSSAETKVGSPWVRFLWQQTCKLYFCEYLYRSGNHRTYHTIVGTATNSLAACQMAEYLTDTIIRLANEAKQAQPSEIRGRYFNDFKKACGDRVTRRLRVMRQTAEKPTLTNNSNLPMLYANTKQQLDAYMQDVWGNRKSTASRMQGGTTNGTYDGRAAGENIGLNTQVTGGTAHGRITHGI